MRLRRMRRMMLMGLLCAGIAAGVVYGTRLRTFNISTVTVTGGVTVDLAAVERKVQSALDGSYFFLIPRRFSYTYPHDSIVSAAKEVTRVQDVVVERTGTALSVIVTEYMPYALWCKSIDSVEGDSHCLFVTEEGWAFAPAPSLRGAILLRYATEGREPQVQTMLAPADYMKATRDFAAALAEKHGLSVSAIVETPDGDVRYRLRGGGELLLKRDADIGDVLGNLGALLSSDEFKHISTDGFVYIDLRFGDKVFVKESKDEIEQTGSASTTATTTTVSVPVRTTE